MNRDQAGMQSGHRSFRRRLSGPRSAAAARGVALAAAVVAVLVFASCGAGETEAAEIRSAPAEHSPEIGHHLRYDGSAEMNGGEPIVLEFWTQADYEDIYSRLIADYQRLHPNVEIRLSSVSWGDHRSRLYTALESGIGPDIVHMHNSMSGQLIPHLQPYPRALFPIDVLERDFRQVRSHLVDGHLYFIDTGLMTGAILYNSRHWAEAGLGEDDFPRTWDELYSRARRLTVYGEDGSVMRAGFNPNGMGFALFTALNLQQGQPMFLPEEPRRPVIATEASARSLDFIRKLYLPPAVTDPRLPEAHESFGFENASMIYAWGWVLNWLQLNAGSLELAAFPLPSWDGDVPPAYDRNNGEISMGVSRYSDPAVQAVAFDLIRFYLASDEYLLEVSRRFGTYPSKISLAEEFAGDGSDPQAAFRKILERSVWPGALPQTYEEHLIQYAIDPVVLDGADIATALKTAERILTPIMRYESFISRENRYAHASEFAASVRFLD